MSSAVLSSAEGKGPKRRPFPRPPSRLTSWASLRFAPDGEKISCHSDHSRSQSGSQRRFAPTSLIDYRRTVIGFRGE